MSGGQRYWNEETQRWEDGTAGALPAGPPPPPRPDFSPSAPQDPDGHPAPGPGGPDGPSGTWSLPEPPHTAPWPPTESTAPAPAPAAGSRGPSRRVVWSVLGGAAVAGVATALVLTLVMGGDGDGEGGTHGGPSPVSASPSLTAEPSAPAADSPGPSPDETATPSGPSSAPPAGYELHTDPEGFTLARPVGWIREAVASQHGIDVVTYRSSDGERRLQIFEVAEPSPDDSFELFLSEDTPKAEGFERLSLENLDDGDFTGTRLEYLAASLKGGPDIGTWHVVDLRFQAADGKVYAIAAYGPDADGRDDERELVHTALGHFCPPYTECGTDAGPF
ncbi:hypothetical protein AB0L74_15050 [Streptomyces sp. NPDC052020]|uniref:hypothetical protein n=1 Tax=Streptomyces sp. NPDC052020 TaxID=3155677 RepID=UPI003423B898